MKFEDEPVPGYPLPILPGHVSPGRFERVLRAGWFAVTAELAPTRQDTLILPKWGNYFETNGKSGEAPDLPVRRNC